MIILAVAVSSLLAVTPPPIPAPDGPPMVKNAPITGPSPDCKLAPTYAELATRKVTWADWPKFLVDVRAVNSQHTTRHFHLPPGLEATTEQSLSIRVALLQHMARSRISMMHCEKK